MRIVDAECAECTTTTPLSPYLGIQLLLGFFFSSTFLWSSTVQEKFVYKKINL